MFVNHYSRVLVAVLSCFMLPGFSHRGVLVASQSVNVFHPVSGKPARDFGKKVLPPKLDRRPKDLDRIKPPHQVDQDKDSKENEQKEEDTATVSGMVKEAGANKPLKGVEVRLVRQDGPRENRIRKVSTGADGHFKFKDILPTKKRCQLQYRKDGYQSYHENLTFPEAVVVRRTVKLHKKAPPAKHGDVRGTVVDKKTGKTVRGVHVWSYGRNRAETGADGKFHFKHMRVRPEGYDFNFNKEGYETPKVNKKIKAGDNQFTFKIAPIPPPRPYSFYTKVANPLIHTGESTKVSAKVFYGKKPRQGVRVNFKVTPASRARVGSKHIETVQTNAKGVATVVVRAKNKQCMVTVHISFRGRKKLFRGYEKIYIRKSRPARSAFGWKIWRSTGMVAVPITYKVLGIRGFTNLYKWGVVKDRNKRKHVLKDSQTKGVRHSQITRKNVKDRIQKVLKKSKADYKLLHLSKPKKHLSLGRQRAYSWGSVDSRRTGYHRGGTIDYEGTIYKCRGMLRNRGPLILKDSRKRPFAYMVCGNGRLPEPSLDGSGPATVWFAVLTRPLL
ncbi:MAG: carboxypeptidase regulatory-like domain-containing protein [Planctomycetes bacterium]|nr:carboxypeptidase regulatory-like domain-containing protein [Planctomycetota bacterium]